MGVPYIAVRYRPDGNRTSWIDITEFITINPAKGLQATANTAEFDIVNVNNRFSTKPPGASRDKWFLEDDDIEIYADWQPITYSQSQLIFSGNIIERNQKRGTSNRIISIKAVDRTFIILNKLWAKHYENTKPDEIIKQVIASTGKTKLRDGTIIQITTNNVNPQGYDFEPVDYTVVYKPVYEILEELSQPGFLYNNTLGRREDRSWIFWVDSNNDLHWQYPEQETNLTLTEGADKILNYNLTLTTFDVVNMIIYYGGEDWYGNEVLGYFLDLTSESSHLKMKLQPMRDIGTNVKDTELKFQMNAGKIVQDDSTPGALVWQEKRYTATYPIVPHFPLVDFYGNSVSDTVDSDYKYNKYLRNWIRFLCNERARKITQKYGNPRYKGSIELIGTNAFTPGDLIKVTVESENLNNYKLRIHDVQHNFTRNGWFTTLQLEEDEKAVST